MKQQRRQWTTTQMNWWVNPQENQQVSDQQGNPPVRQLTHQLENQPTHPPAIPQPNSRRLNEWKNNGANRPRHKWTDD
jgi:hypothetical protein